MALVKGTNSYATVEEADAYFTDRIDVVAWTTATAEQKAQALVTASRLLDDMRWTGTAVSEVQPLAFPRNGQYFDPRLGSYVTLTEDVPSRIVLAVYELAYHFLNNDGVLDDTSRVRNITVGPIKLEESIKASVIPNGVRSVVRPLLINSGSNPWWRAN